MDSIENGVSIIFKIYVHLEKSNYLYMVIICLYRFRSLFLDIYSTLVYIVLIQMGVRDATNSSRVLLSNTLFISRLLYQQIGIKIRINCEP